MQRHKLHPTLNRRTGVMEDKPNLARSGGQPKGQGCVPVHSGMRDRTGGKSLPGNWRDLSPDASSPNPLDPEPRGKEYAPVKASPGMLAHQGHARAG